MNATHAPRCVFFLAAALALLAAPSSSAVDLCQYPVPLRQLSECPAGVTCANASRLTLYEQVDKGFSGLAALCDKGDLFQALDLFAWPAPAAGVFTSDALGEVTIAPLAAAADVFCTGCVGTVDVAADSVTADKFSVERTVTVGLTGKFTTIGAAITYVATQTRAAGTRWLIDVAPGAAAAGTDGLSAYVESGVAVPSFTTVQCSHRGRPGGATFPGPATSISLTGTSGDLVTCGNDCAIQGCAFYYAATPTAGIRIIALKGGGAAYLGDVQVQVKGTVADTNTIDVIALDTGTSGYLFNIIAQRFGLGSLTRTVVSTSSSGLSLYGGRFSPANASQVNLMETTGSGKLKLWWTRTDPGATFDLAGTGGSIETYYSTYETSTGTVDDELIHANVVGMRPQAAAPYACTAARSGRKYFDSTTPTECFCNGTTTTWTPYVALGDCS